MGMAQEIVRWISAQVEAAGAQGTVLGLSGGLDSAVTATLCKRAAGDRMLGLIMPCPTSSEHLELARLAARELGIPTRLVPLDEPYQQLVDLLPDDGGLARANLKPRLRMVVLYYFANVLNYLVVGTGNRSEISVGYFTKFGDGGVDILPLGNLLKTEVRELARQLDVPERIIAQVPSAGLWEGQTDEGEMGITYEELDRTLSAIELDKTAQIPPDILARVQAMMEASKHKRSLPPIFRKQ